MPTTTLARTNYETLLNRVRKVLAEGRARAKRALEHEEVRTWWEAAQIINKDLRAHDGRAAYGKQVVPKLAADLGVSKEYLYDILRFQRTFPIVDSSPQLTLTHYRILSSIENSKGRARLYRKAVRDKLSAPELLNEIRSQKLLGSEDLKLDDAGDKAERVKPHLTSPLAPRRGEFFTYRIVKPRDLHPTPEFFSIDLGFMNRIDLKLGRIKEPKEGEIIQAIRTEENNQGDRYKFKRVEIESGRPEELLYTYKATVKKVIDDDTLWTDIDLGFHFWTERKLRLRGIDAAEIEKGKAASDFVKRTLARVSFVVIKLSGRDKFDRALTDLFYLEGTEEREKVLREGKFLNQELLDLGLAKRVNA